MMTAYGASGKGSARARGKMKGLAQGKLKMEGKMKGLAQGNMGKEGPKGGVTTLMVWCTGLLKRRFLKMMFV